MPRSTMLTGISGSSTSRGAARPPALQDVLPGAGIVEVPALGIGVERAGERVVERPDLLAVLALLLLAVRGDRDADLLAVRHDQRQPPLAQAVVRLALEAVVELEGVALARVRQAEPLDREWEHPVDRGLQLVARLAARLRHAASPGAAVPEVEVLLEHHLVEAPLPGAVGAVPVDVAEEAEPGLVVEEVGDDQLGPALQGDVERV